MEYKINFFNVNINDKDEIVNTINPYLKNYINIDKLLFYQLSVFDEINKSRLSKYISDGYNIVVITENCNYLNLQHEFKIGGMIYLNEVWKNHLVGCLKNMYERKLKKRLVIKFSGGYEVIDLNEVLFIKGERNYSFIYLYNKKKITVSKNLKLLENIIYEHKVNIIRYGKSYILNIDKITKIKGNLIFFNDIALKFPPYSKGYKDLINTILNNK